VFGRAYRLYGLLRFSFVTWRALVSWSSRYLLHLPIEWQIAAEAEFQDRPAFDMSRRRIALQGIYHYRRRQWFSLQFEFSDTRLRNLPLDFSVDPTLIAREFENLRLARVVGSWVVDTRDSVLNATRGHFWTASVELSLRAWGSDVDFVKLSGQWNQYVALTPFWVFAVRQQIGWGRRLGDFPLLPLSQRFFAGGSTSHRGFSVDMLGPIAPISKAPLGGNAMWITSIEHRFQIHKTWGIVLFLDIGNVFPRAFDLRLAALREAGGIGIRYLSPIGAVGVDFAWLLDRRPEEKGFRWFVTIGQNF